MGYNILILKSKSIINRLTLSFIVLKEKKFDFRFWFWSINQVMLIKLCGIVLFPRSAFQPPLSILKTCWKTAGEKYLPIQIDSWQQNFMPAVQRKVLTLCWITSCSKLFWIELGKETSREFSNNCSSTNAKINVRLQIIFSLIPPWIITKDTWE